MVNEPRNDQLERQYWIGQIPKARGIYDSRSHFNLELDMGFSKKGMELRKCKKWKSQEPLILEQSLFSKLAIDSADILMLKI